MAITHGHGNPNWTRDEIILALDLYFDCEGDIPSRTDKRVKSLSDLLRSFPHHSLAARKGSFRNADGVAFKLQNLRQIATGKGLGNVSKADRAVWNEFGNNRSRTKKIAALIRSAVRNFDGATEEASENEVFTEGRVLTETHIRRERDTRIRKRLLKKRRKSGTLKCDLCQCGPSSQIDALGEAMFEAHHLLPLAAATERTTRLEDIALLCANCHRMIHRAIALEKRWLSIDEAKLVIRGKTQT